MTRKQNKTLLKADDRYWLIKASNLMFDYQKKIHTDSLTSLDQLELMAIVFEAAQRYPKIQNSKNFSTLMGKITSVNELYPEDLKGLRNRLISILEKEHGTLGFLECGWKSKSLKPTEGRSLYSKLQSISAKFDLVVSLHEFDCFSIVEVTGTPVLVSANFKAAFESLKK